MTATIPQRMSGCDKYRLNTLDLMQSVTIAVPPNQSVRKTQQAISATCRKPSLRTAGKRFTTRTNGNTVSVWRVE
jgi:hypothetical protein